MASGVELLHSGEVQTCPDAGGVDVAVTGAVDVPVRVAEVVVEVVVDDIVVVGDDVVAEVVADVMEDVGAAVVADVEPVLVVEWLEVMLVGHEVAVGWPVGFDVVVPAVEVTTVDWLAVLRAVVVVLLCENPWRSPEGRHVTRAAVRLIVSTISRRGPQSKVRLCPACSVLPPGRSLSGIVADAVPDVFPLCDRLPS